jgi:preprotein translocase subunit SecA
MSAVAAYHLLKSGFRPVEARLSRWRTMSADILAMEPQMRALATDELMTKGREIRWRAKAGESLERLLPETFALVRESARRALGYQHYPVQLMGGIAMFEGGIAEMQTGEGKTLTATLTATLRAWAGLGCHIVTVNDYLAKRDAETMGPVYTQLGLTVGCIQDQQPPPQRRQAYAQDITYGTAKELGFDFLRDRLKLGIGAAGKQRPSLFGGGQSDNPEIVQRGHHFVLIDEADSILVDEARTPLIIALTQPNDASTVNLYRWSDRAALELKPHVDFEYEADKRSAYLTDPGCRHVLLLSKPALMDSIEMERIYKQVEQSLVARYGFQLNRDYVVHNGEIVIVDESTGRMMEGRKWQDGLHQAIEAKERIPITAATGQAARITVQSFFRHYRHIAGMTGTAVQCARELWRTFHIQVTPIPTHRPCIREGLPYRIFNTLRDKLGAIVEDIVRLQAEGRAVLIGTPSVERSELLGEMLRERGFHPQILNAKKHKEEADIVADAGQPRHITIATNMAGRGTDIHLHPDVQANGGLHVIATEMHSSYRIDRQLVGRCARQGDPGTFRFYLSLDDELLRCLSKDKLQRLRNQAVPDANGELSVTAWLGFFRRTQRFLERQHIKQRKQLLKAERMRTDMYERMGLDPFLEMTD